MRRIALVSVAGLALCACLDQELEWSEWSNWEYDQVFLYGSRPATAWEISLEASPELIVEGRYQGALWLDLSLGAADDGTGTGDRARLEVVVEARSGESWEVVGSDTVQVSFGTARQWVELDYQAFDGCQEDERCTRDYRVRIDSTAGGVSDVDLSVYATIDATLRSEPADDYPLIDLDLVRTDPS